MTVGKRDAVQDWIFRQVHERHLVYNACWEDPRCDRQLLGLDRASEVVMITSAGCNALDYLLDQPHRIHCVDVNPRQNALLHLKQSLFRQGAHADLFQLFGEGRHPEAPALYRDQLREQLPDASQRYWDANLHYFSPNGLRQSFYHYGSSGMFAWLVSTYLRARPRLFAKLDRLFAATSLEEQRALYPDIERRVLTPLLRWLVNRHLALCLLGVPRSQQHLFRNQYVHGAFGFIRACIRKVFTEIPISDNYFYRVYLYGKYAPECCPNYLRPEHFDMIRAAQYRLRTHDTTITGFLRANPGAYSHFVLLDHQDWLAARHRDALAEEWRAILDNSRSGTRILLRSAARKVRFFPEFVRQRVRFEENKTRATHRQDRVGTYASVYLGIVQ